jgi:hypothetical protein
VAVAGVTRPIEEFEEALRFVRWGMNDCQVSRLTGIPLATVRGWRTKTQNDPLWVPGTFARASDCPICGDGELNPSSYAYLLGMYLGDGHIVHQPRTTKLGISLDAKYPGIIYECTEAIADQRERGVMKVGLQSYDTWVVVTGHWQHWPCLFPQHGPGLKHRRKIELKLWQQEILEEHPDRLLRGLIHSDGWRGTNTVVRPVQGRPKTYSYPRYQFCNESADIRTIFGTACEAFGVQWRQMNRKTLSVARGPDVAKLDQVIGLKK